MQTRHKQAQDENFPVASLMISKQLRPLVMDYYEFARYCDDIADNPDLLPEEKLTQLQEIADIFCGKKKYRGNKLSFAAKLKNDFWREELDASLANDLLVAFRRDSQGEIYETWEQLVNYCLYSAVPVGRFMLAIHNESTITYQPAAALCVALQIVNHLQDIKYDLLKLNRLYLPADLMKKYKVKKEDLLQNQSTPKVKKLIHHISALVQGQLEESLVLPQLVRSWRLRYQLYIILSLTNIMLKKINKGDVLKSEICLNIWDWTKAISVGIMRGLFARSRLYRKQ